METGGRHRTVVTRYGWNLVWQAYNNHYGAVTAISMAMQASCPGHLAIASSYY